MRKGGGTGPGDFMDHPSQLQQIVEQEPWRQGDGQPRGALDPTWEPGPDDLLCGGDVEYEPGTKWWVCQDCGYIGSAYTQNHQRAQNPYTFLMKSVQFFMSKKGEAKNALHTMAFVAGTAIRYAAVAPNLRDFIRKMIK